MTRYLPLVFALAVAGVAGMAAAQTRDETPDQNVRQSQQYQQLLCTNATFRAKRIAQECGPLEGSQFYDGCVASFNCNGKQPTGANWRQPPPSQTTR